MSVIQIVNVWKQFHLHTARPRTMKEALVQSFRRPTGDEPSKTFWALKDVSFEIEKGETFGIIGTNGSGKSTLLKLITGISKPTRGVVAVDGRVSALLELGAGFHPDFSGRENTFLNGAILGLSRKEVEQKFESIVAFAELERFIDNPVKTYSSGMYMRLAFSIAIHVDPDILVIDEVLAVGDGAFQQKCFDQIQRFKHAGKTIVFVSHSLGSVKELCQRAAWLDKGVLRAVGPTSSVIDFYAQQINESIEKNKHNVDLLLPDGRATLRNLRAFDHRDQETGQLHNGELARFAFELDATLPLQDLDLVARILRSDGICCYDQRVRVGEIVEGGSEAILEMRIPELRLNQGTYVFNLNIALNDEDKWLDEKFFNFSVESVHSGIGVAPLGAEWLPLNPIVRDRLIV